MAATAACCIPTWSHRDALTRLQNVPAQDAPLSRDCLHPAALGPSAILTDGGPPHETCPVAAARRTRCHAGICAVRALSEQRRGGRISATVTAHTGEAARDRRRAALPQV